MVLLAPAHPPATRLEYPRLVEDAAAVAALGLDTQSLLREVGEDLERFFLDSIHPSPSGLDLLARAAAKALAPVLDPPHLSSALEIIEVSPRVISSLGDVPVHLTLEGWTRADPLPVVLIGGAPLVALRAVGEHEVSGTLMANRAGVYDVIAQATSGVAVLPNSVTLVPPRVELVNGPPLGVRFVARPGDRAQIHFATTLRDAPKWSSNGGLWLEAPQAFESFVVADKNGNATLQVPALDPAVEEVHLQALVVPRGVPDEAASGARAWTPPSTAKP
jgi:putative intracellular protease/amidase